MAREMTHQQRRDLETYVMGMALWRGARSCDLGETILRELTRYGTGPTAQQGLFEAAWQNVIAGLDDYAADQAEQTEETRTALAELMDAERSGTETPGGAEHLAHRIADHEKTLERQTELLAFIRELRQRFAPEPADEDTLAEQMVDDIREAGAKARREGKPMSACPYQGHENRYLRDYWNSGWADADQIIRHEGEPVERDIEDATVPQDPEDR